MPEILLLTGNCGVGKTTVANAWADARGGAAVHADDIHMWIRVRSVRRDLQYQERLKAEVSLTTARHLVEQGLSVAVDNVWMPGMLAPLREALASLAPVHVVRLVCDRGVNRARDAGRPAGRMGRRVDELGDELDGLTWPAFVTMVDSTALTVAETLARMDAATASLGVTATLN